MAYPQSPESRDTVEIQTKNLGIVTISLSTSHNCFFFTSDLWLLHILVDSVSAARDWCPAAFALHRCSFNAISDLISQCLSSIEFSETWAAFDVLKHAMQYGQTGELERRGKLACDDGERHNFSFSIFPLLPETHTTWIRTMCYWVHHKAINPFTCTPALDHQ